MTDSYVITESDVAHLLRLLETRRVDTPNQAKAIGLAMGQALIKQWFAELSAGVVVDTPTVTVNRAPGHYTGSIDLDGYWNYVLDPERTSRAETRNAQILEAMRRKQ